jgi:hypothetical protein
MWIRTVDGSLSYEGIGWRDATNHGHLNLDVRRGRAVIPITPPGPVDPPVSGDLAALKLYIDAEVKAEVRRYLGPVADAWRELD